MTQSPATAIATRARPLSAALATNVRAETLNAARDQIVTGIVVVSAGIAVGVTLLILHQKHRQSKITGCVNAGASGMDVPATSESIPSPAIRLAQNRANE